MSFAPSRTRLRISLLSGLLLLTSLAARPTSAQKETTAQGQSFGSAAEITAVDLLVDIPQQAPKDLAKEDLSVIVDGQARLIVDLEEASLRDPWHIVLYLDTILHGDKELRWAAKLWASSLEELLALGRVDLVVADPEPRVLHRGDQDSDLLAVALARLSMDVTGEAQVNHIREQSLSEDRAEDRSDDEALSPLELLTEESGLVRHRLETLLLHLTSAPSETSRKVVLWAGSAFTLRPEDFYEVALPTPPSLEQTAIDTARTLAAYEWVVLPMARPLPENRAGIKPGLRIGKLRFTLGNDLALPGFTVAFEEERDAEKADAHAALAEVLANQGKAEEAIAELQTALHHYYGDPRTADRQALAYTRMGDLLTEIDREDWARRAYEAARELTRGDPDSKKKKILAPPPSISDDSSLAPPLDDRPAGLAEIDPATAFELLTETTAGAAIRDAKDLEAALTALPRRRRVTFQIEGPVSARLLPLEIRFQKKGIEGRVPLWTRHGTPDTLAAARVRAALLGDLPSTTEELLAEVKAGDGAREGALVISRQGAWQHSRRLRLSVARAGFDGVIHVEHQKLETLEDSAEAFQFPFDRNPEEPFLAVVLEDLETGHWAVRLVDED